MKKDIGRVLTDQALVSDQAATRLDPSGFDPSREPWLHIRSQFTYHGEAHIVGTRAGLLSLRGALDQAIETGLGSADATASDGEGYEVSVERTRTVAGLGRPTYLNVAVHDLMAQQEAYLIQSGKLLARQRREAMDCLRWCRANGNPHLASGIAVRMDGDPSGAPREAQEPGPAKQGDAQPFSSSPGAPS